MRRWLQAVLVSCACGNDDGVTSMGGHSEHGGTGASGSGTGSAEGSATNTSTISDSVSSAEASGNVDSETTSGDSMASSGESTTDGGSAVDPYALCAGARSEAECEGVAIEATPKIASPSCQWREVYSVSVEEQCTLLDATARCILFFGNLQGCGGPGCTFPNDGELYVREVEGIAELLTYPRNDVCGPLPEAPAGEPAWADCAGSSHSACACICDLL